MSFPRYSEYKDSGVAWLGKVPAHWGVGQSRRLFALRNERANASDKQLTASQEHGVIYQEDFVRLEGRRVMEVIKGADILKHVEPNDFVISMRSFQGGIEWCQYRGCISSAYVMLVPCARIHAAFFAYLFKSGSYIQALQATTNLVRDGQALRYENFAQVPLPIVSLDEQAAIASFLDREIAKIDALATEQQRLIELLKEKRQAIISHAVTKGPNPGAPMKSSGIEWLGDIPAHWSIRSLGSLADVVDPNPSHRNPEYVEAGFPFISTVEFRGRDGIELETPRRVSEETVVEQEARCRFRKGSLAFSRKGTIGAVRILPEGHRFALLDSLCVINCHGSLSYRFLYLQLASGFVKHQLERNARGAALSQLSVGAVRRISIVVAPLAEQQAIVDALFSTLYSIDEAIDAGRVMVELLNERRAALISAAVTGQIDVRAITDKAAA